MTERRYASIAGWAEITGTSPSTVRREIARGNIPACKIGKQVRIPIAEAEASLQWIGSARPCAG